MVKEEDAIMDVEVFFQFATRLIAYSLDVGLL